MTSQSPRIYTYKITFEEVPYYYYGVHKEKYLNEEYWGSPITNKWCWNFYTPKKQILQLFDFKDEGWKESLEIEYRLIKQFYNTDKWCLNRNCGGNFSLETRRKNGKNAAEIHKKLKKGLYSLTTEQRSQNSKRMVELKRGCHKLTKQERVKRSKEKSKTNLKNKTGIYANLSENGKKGAEVNRQNNTGLWAFTTEYRSQITKETNSQKWKCTITGYVSNAGGLSNYQKHRGINTSNRIRIE
jgi:hypothetical protein